MTLAAIIRCGNVASRLGDHDYPVMSCAVMAACAILGDPGRIMVEALHSKAGESRAVTHQTILSTCRYVGNGAACGLRSIVT